MLSDFENFVSKNKLFSKKDKLLLAISGGEDSICLFHLLLENKYNFHLAHCNFTLRGEDSNKDASFIAKLAKKHNITAHIIEFETKKESKKLKIGIQETARKLRYDWFETLRKVYQYDYVLTAHHQTDNTETMLINMLRSTGISGLHGIPLKNEFIVRPLLFTNSSALKKYRKSKKYAFRKDVSNDSDDYLRNRIRHHLLNELFKIDCEADSKFLTVANNVKEYEILNNNLLELHSRQFITESKTGKFIHQDIFNNIENPSALLFILLKQYGFTKASVDAFKNFKEIQTGAKLESNEWILMRERNGFSLEKRKIFSNISKTIDSIGIFQISDSLAVEIRIINHKQVNFKDTSTIYLNYDKCPFPYVIRNWEKADRMQPLGMKGSKKISDILTDKKIKHAERNSQMLITDLDNNIIALLPNTIDNTYRIDDVTKCILSISTKSL